MVFGSDLVGHYTNTSGLALVEWQLLGTVESVAEGLMAASLEMTTVVHGGGASK